MDYAEIKTELDREIYRKECEELVSRPGKFEGEPRFSPHFYNICMDGNGSEIQVQESDVEIFPELLLGQYVTIDADDNGFVYSILTSHPLEQPEGILE